MSLFSGKVKAAFNKLKSLNVRKELKQFGTNVVNRLLDAVNISTKKAGKPCERTVEFIETAIFSDLVSEIRTEFCEDQDIGKMQRAVKIVADEAMELTPRDTGRLQKSQFTQVMVEGKEIVGTVGYDISQVVRTQNGKAIFYALAVHNRNADHSKGNNPPRATWRFLHLAFTNQLIQQKVRDIFE